MAKRMPNCGMIDENWHRNMRNRFFVVVEYQIAFAVKPYVGRRGVHGYSSST